MRPPVCTRLRLGPFTVAMDEDAPASWHAYLHAICAAPIRNEAPELIVRVRPIAPGQGSSPDIVVDEMDITRDPHGFKIATRAIHATADLDARVLEIDVKAWADEPHLTLGNALRGFMSIALPLRCDGVMLHASSGILRDEGFACAGVSTAGKTTFALGLRQGVFLSDDISLVTSSSSAPLLRESAFYGSAGRRGSDQDAPLRAVALLSKSIDGTRVVRLKRAHAVVELMRHVVCFCRDAEVQGALLDRIGALTSRVPVFSVARDLRDDSDDVAALLLRRACEEAGS